MKKRIEIKGVDAARLAYLHIPLGFILGLSFAAWFVHEEFVRRQYAPQPHSYEKTAMLCVLMFPCIVFVVYLAAWLQAKLVNMIFALLKAGPVLEIEVKDDKADRFS
ncbi:MAG: hypothetical protein JXR97_00215 [Planctomycetes bacterium]|nr:hypothetical protein [Planctomycetota bacterium]